MRVAIQPARLSDRKVRKHYNDTIIRSVAFDDHVDLLDIDVRAELHRLFPVGSAPMWGVLPGKDDANVGKVSRLRAGDCVLFYGDKKCYLAGTVALRWHNRELAQRLWEDNAETPPQTWEHMYALDDLRKIDVPIEELRLTLGWSDTAIAQNFNIYKQEKADRLAELCNLDPSERLSSVADPDEDAATQPGDDPDDSPMERLVARELRKEQGPLKKRLIELGAYRCALCGQELPKPFLVAAHIKLRCECTNREKRDFDNVAMLACLLGCDSLFEHGYISVDTGGKIILSPIIHEAPAVHQHVAANLAGKVCDWWSPKREPYFAWHRNHTFKTTP